LPHREFLLLKLLPLIIQTGRHDSCPTRQHGGK